MEYIVPLFVSFFVLTLIVVGGQFAISAYRASIQSNDDEQNAIHSLLAALQKSLDDGEISPEEYRTVKAQLTAQLHNLADR